MKRLLFVLVMGCSVDASAWHRFKGVPLGQHPAMGFNTFYVYGTSFTEANVRAQADAIVSKGLLAAGYNFVMLDDGWSRTTASGGRSGGHLVADATNFPSGIPALASYVHAKCTGGHCVQFGQYLNLGTVTCDSARPGSEGFFATDATDRASEGSDMVKADGCFVTGGTEADYANAYDNFASAAHSVSRSYFLLVSAPAYMPDFQSFIDYMTNHVSSQGQIWRTGADIGTPSTLVWDNGTVGVLRNYKYSRWLARFGAATGGFNDPDMVLCGALTSAQLRSQFSTWAVMSAPLILGCDLTALAGTPLSIVTNADAIAIDQSGRQGYPIYTDGHTSGEDVLMKHVTGDEYAVVVFNPSGSSTSSITVTASQLGFSGTFNYREVWGGATGTGVSSFSVTLAAYDSALYIITNGGTPTTTGQITYTSSESAAATYQCMEWDSTDAYMRIRTCNGQPYEQISQPGDGTLHLKNPASPFNDQCFTYDAASPPKVVLATCDGTTKQKWTYSKSGAISNQLSGLCIDDGTALSINGSPLEMKTCAWSGGAQTWSAPFAQ